MPQPVRSGFLASGPSFSSLLLERVGQNANEHRPWKLTAEVQSARLKVNGKEKFLEPHTKLQKPREISEKN